MTGEQLKKWRESHRLPDTTRPLTRAQLSALSNLPVRTLQGFEQGARPMHALMERALRDMERQGDVVAM